MKHKFDITIASHIGVVAAIIFEDINYWIQKNTEKNQNFYEDKYWTFCSQQNFQDKFPYLSPWEIRQGLKSLLENQYIIKNNFNKKRQDRTIWYALGPKFESICEIHKCNCQNPQMQLLKSTNAPESICEIHECICEIHEPLPNNRPENNICLSINNKKNISKARAREDWKEKFKDFWIYGFTKEREKLAYEVIDVLIDALDRSKNGFVFNKKQYTQNQLDELFDRLTDEDLSKIVWQLKDNFDIQNRSQYILGALLNRAHEVANGKK